MIATYDPEKIKQSVLDWIPIFTWAGMPCEYLNDNEGPCVKCEGNTRFRILDRKAGALFCSHCFNSKNGDGIAALQWWWGISFQETLERLAEYLDIEPDKKSRKKKADPAEKLEFIPWVETFAQMYCQANPGIHVEALKQAGARMAYYYGQHTVIALPIYGAGLINAGPVGWIVQDIGHNKLPKFDPSGKIADWVKRKITYGSKPGIVGDAAARALADPNVKTIYKMEGVSDHLAMQSCLLAEPRTDATSITTASGAGEDWRKHPWLIELLKGRELRVIHDCDQPGQDGTEKILAATSKTCTAKNYVLPYPVKPTHGEDFRDWIGSGVAHPVATLEAAFLQIQPSQAEPELHFGADNDPHVLASKFLAEHRYEGKNTWRYWREDWYHWSGTQYHMVQKQEFKGQLTQALKRYADEAYNASKAAGGEDVHPFRVTTRLVADVANAIHGECQIPGSVSMGSMWNGSRWIKRDYLALANGILDIEAHAAERSDYLLPNTPDWFSTVNLNYEFDADRQCPRWLSFLTRNLEGDRERLNLVQEWAGYLLTPDTSHQKFMILEGEGANGKSVFLSGVTAVIGKGNTSSVPLELFGQQFALNATLGKLANISGDCGEIDKLAEGQLKSFTSGDIMSFERKYKDSISDKPTARLMVATNNRPRFADKSDGLWRRMILIPWRIQIPVEERVHGMDSVSFWQESGELPGILQWALLGLRRLRQQRRFTESTICNTARDSYKLENNPAREFLADNFQADRHGFVPTSEIYKQYSEWCHENGYKPMGSRTFGKEITRIFPGAERTQKTISTSSRSWGYSGISKKSDVEQTEMNF